MEAPVVEEGAGGVRLMTVHSAKGLEFPVVILADITANLAAMNPERRVDAEKQLCAMRLIRCAPVELTRHEAEEHGRELAEGVRVAYVAATRARDLLVTPRRIVLVSSSGDDRIMQFSAAGGIMVDLVRQGAGGLNEIELWLSPGDRTA